MSFTFTTNVLLPALGDKLGQILITLKDALVAGGRWRVRGSGDGRSAFQLDGQTAGNAGSFDIFTATPPYLTDTSGWTAARNNSFTQPKAWLLLEEIASGRVIGFHRGISGGNTWDITTVAVGVATAVATSGASATTPPALAGNSAYLVGTGWHPNLIGLTAEMFGGATNDFNQASNHQAWMQIGVDTEVHAGNVSPWFFSIWNRTTNLPVSGGVWAAMTDLDSGQTHPFACALGNWSRVWGLLGNGSTGAIYSGSRWVGGETLAPCTLAYVQNAGIGAAPPLYQAVGNNGKYQTERPWVLQPSLGSRHLGRLAGCYMNKLAREYPTTYDIAGAEPRLTLGHLIVPWTAVVPESSP